MICDVYIPTLFDYIFPPMSIFRGVCISYDKTSLFITSVIRLALWWLILECSETYITERFPKIYTLLYIFVVVNMIVLGIVLIKQPVSEYGPTNKRVIEMKPLVINQIIHDDDRMLE